MTQHHPASSAEPVPQLLRAWLQPFRSVFTAPVWEHALVRALGALLAPGCSRSSGASPARRLNTRSNRFLSCVFRRAVGASADSTRHHTVSRDFTKAVQMIRKV
jgi:hypothetical protein